MISPILPARRAITILVGLGLCGSAWAAGFVSHCSACDRTSAVVPGVNLGLIGLAYYGALLAVLLWKGPNRVAVVGIHAAIGVHATLVAVLVARGIFCPPCALTALAALAAGGLAARSSRDHFRLALKLVPAAAVLAALAIGGVRALAQERHHAAIGLAVRLATATPVSPDREVRLVVYYRTGCHVCREFDEAVLPRLREEFGEAIEVEHVPAAPELSTPTIVVIGQTTPILFEGLPSTTEIAQSIRDARG